LLLGDIVRGHGTTSSSVPVLGDNTFLQIERIS
jgi:hypothetical protein